MSLGNSKIGLEASRYILDNNCGEYLNRGLFLKIKKIICYYSEKSILALFPFYEVDEYDRNITKSDFFQYFNKNFLEKGNKIGNLSEEIKSKTIKFDDDEFIQSIDVAVSKNENLNENQIYAINILTNKNQISFGMDKIFSAGKYSNEYKEFTIKKLKVENEFIIGFKFSFENEIEKEFDTKIPHLSFMKIYTEKIEKRENYLPIPKDKDKTIEPKNSIVKFFKYFFYLLLILFTVFSIVFAYYYSSQNILKGLLTLDSDIAGNILNHPTKLHTDENGFVHIKAETLEDAFFTLGIAHSRDRLFQMDFLRRLSLGRLSEVLGEKALKIDKLMRTIGINRYVQKDYEYFLDKNRQNYDAEMVKKMKKYVNGVNYYANKHFLPPEYFILNFKFENWTVLDSLACARFHAFTLSLDWPLELFNKIFEETLGKDFNDLIKNVSHRNFYLSDKTVLSEEEIENLKLSKKLFEKEERDVLEKSEDNEKNNYELKITTEEIAYRESTYESIENFEAISHSEERKILPNDLITGQASNSWVISGKFTSTGKPFLSNDPHLKNIIPGMHYIVKLYIGNMTNPDIIVGSAPAGLPIFLIGSNNHMSWGMTTDNRDIGDICEEKLDDESIEKSKYYYVGDKKFELEESKEVIKIKGKENFEFIVKSSRNGPLIEEFIKEIGFFGLDYKYKSNKKESDLNAPNAISLRLITFKFHDVVSLFSSLITAKSKEDFLPLTENFPGPLLALVWATTNGEIGYTPIGKVPIKKNNQSKFCKGYLDDSKSEDIITGFIPRKETPLLINPEKGFIVTANNRQLPDNYLYDTQSYAYYYRFHRITQLIDEVIHKEKRQFDLNDNKSILFDVLDLNCQYVLPKLLNIIQKNFDSIEINLEKYEKKLDNIKSYIEALKNFDCHFYKNSTSATIYSVLEYNIGKNLLLRNKKNNLNTGFIKEIEARAMLNNFNYWNFIQKFIESIETKTEETQKLNNIDNCKFYRALDTCEGYLISTFERLDDFLDDGYKNEDGNVKEWGQVHFHYYPHVFDSNPILKSIFSRKISTDGNRYTVKVSKNKFDDITNGPFVSNHSANLKFISDLSDISCPYIIIDTGNSGNILSKFYDNLTEKCEKNELIKIKNHSFNDDNSLLISFPEHNTLIIRNK